MLAHNRLVCQIAFITTARDLQIQTAMIPIIDRIEGMLTSDSIYADISRSFGIEQSRL